MPALLHRLSESKQVALKHYDLAFSWKIPHRLASSESGPDQREAKVWFNFKQDASAPAGRTGTVRLVRLQLAVVYFLRKEDTRRVKQYRLQSSRSCISASTSPSKFFGSLLSTLDRFPASRGC